ncbi:MAG: ATPase [Promethearchaeota archaeon]|nr:MAG: ATPase [Candidatus Lokiarchaeota archaeon]
MVQVKGKHKFYILLAIFQIFLAFAVFFSLEGIIGFVSAQTDTTADIDPGTVSIMAISAAIAIGASTIGSAWAIKTTGTAAISALSEREGTFFKAFLIIALAEALAVYGLIVAILIWTKIP